MNKEKNILSENLQEETASYNRRNVNIIKRVIIFFVIIMCVVPVVFCFYLMARMKGMEKKIADLNYKLSLKQQQLEAVTEELTVYSNEDLLVLEQEAYEDMDKKESEGDVLAAADENIEISADGSKETTTVQQGTLSTNSNGKKVYLTFDDGPTIYTHDILDVLEEKNVKATFFVVHHDDEELIDEYQRIVNDGHTIAMHSYTHVYEEIYADVDSFAEDVTNIHDFILETTGVDCTYYRFPGGSSNTVADVDMQDCMAYLDEMGYIYYDWNSLSGDAVDASLTPEELNDNVLQYVRNNGGDSIVLLHDLKNNPATAKALGDLIDILISEGYTICPITHDTDVVQHVKYKGN